MRHVLTLLGLLLAFLLPASARAHDIGAMKVELIPSATGVISVEVLVDLDHVPSKVRGTFAESLRANSWLIVGSRRIPLGTATADETIIENGKPTSKRHLVFETPIAPAPTALTSIGWITTLDMPEYVLLIGERNDQSRVPQWLTGGQSSELLPLAPTTILSTSGLSNTAVFAQYLALGFTHIIPHGTDHILFVVALFLASTRLSSLLKQVTAFTIAHTLTLALTMLDIVRVPSSVVEPLIAVSIIAVAAENLLVKEVRPHRIGLVFLFGLLHGMGFAGVLGELGMPRSQFVPALVGFNVGVEFGQLAVLAAAFVVVGVWSRRKPWYRARVVLPGSLALGLVAVYWTIERVGLLG